MDLIGRAIQVSDGEGFFSVDLILGPSARFACLAGVPADNRVVVVGACVSDAVAWVVMG